MKAREILVGAVGTDVPCRTLLHITKFGLGATIGSVIPVPKLEPIIRVNITLMGNVFMETMRNRRKPMGTMRNCQTPMGNHEEPTETHGNP